MSSVSNLVAGLSFLALAVVTLWTSRRFAVLSALAGVAWFVADVSSWALFVHRPLLLHAALGYPDGRVRDRFTGGLLAVAWAGTLIQPVGGNPAFMLADGGLILIQSIRVRRQIRPGRRADAATASRAAATVGLSLVVPAVVRLWGTAWARQHFPSLTVYNGLVALTAVILVAGVVTSAANGQVDEVVELSEVTPSQTLTVLRNDLAAARWTTDGSRSTEPLRAAAQLLQANAELQATLARNADEVRLSRRRLLDAAVAERQRLENVLAAGALAYLDELSHTLRTLQERVDRETNTLIADGLREVACGHDELEQLARGLHPRVLVQHGLRAALSELAGRCPVPLTVHAPGARYDEAVETALWYACSEAVANIVKHAGAAAASIDVREDDGGLVADICDDGLGGATVTAGGGLAGLADRLSALDGTVMVGPGTDGGTHVRIRVAR